MSTLPLVDVRIAVYRRSYSSSLESSQWFLEKIDSVTWCETRTSTFPVLDARITICRQSYSSFGPGKFTFLMNRRPSFARDSGWIRRSSDIDGIVGRYEKISWVIYPQRSLPSYHTSEIRECANLDGKERVALCIGSKLWTVADGFGFMDPCYRLWIILDYTAIWPRRNCTILSERTRFSELWRLQRPRIWSRNCQIYCHQRAFSVVNLEAIRLHVIT